MSLAEKTIKLSLALDVNWKSISGASELTKTLMRKDRTNNNALQVSWISGDGAPDGVIDPNATLKRWLSSVGAVVEDGLVEAADPGRATMRFSADDFAYCQAWCVVDGEHLINATFLCDELPTLEELREVEDMVASLRIVEGPPAQPRKWMWF
jgi:hypothetical protein